jgi:hypothetical protein
MDYLQKHKDTCCRNSARIWEAAGFKTSGTWEEVFGKGMKTDEIFMGWNYARYVDKVAEAGKARIQHPDVCQRLAQRADGQGAGRLSERRAAGAHARHLARGRSAH